MCQCNKKGFQWCPINVSNHDLQEYHFANTKLDNVTVTNMYIETTGIIFAIFFTSTGLYIYIFFPIFSRHLDISQMNKRQGRYEFANVSLRNLVQELPELTSLDISGTNLAGTGTYDDLKGRILLLIVFKICIAALRVPNEDPGGSPSPRIFAIFSFLFPGERNLGFLNSPNS